MNPDHTLSDIAPLAAALAPAAAPAVPSPSTPSLVLYGAGAAGGYVLRHLRRQGISPLAIVDSNPTKWNQTFPSSTLRDGISGVPILSPQSALASFPDAEWVACAISRPAATEIRVQLKALGVRTRSLWQCLPVQHGLPPENVIREITLLLKDDRDGLSEWWSQLKFRSRPDYDRQRAPTDAGEIYFPDWIARREDEHYVDCGAADGDTVAAFKRRWEKFSQITAFEPDGDNMQKLLEATWEDGRILRFDKAISDHLHKESFTPNSDYSSHLGGDTRHRVQCWTLDQLYATSTHPPTYIKFDIEGSELEALWGARRILLDHRPVLAVCAYHQSEHLWQIPLLLHALQPAYKLAFRRYAEGAFELVWYAVPPDRWKQ